MDFFNETPYDIFILDNSMDSEEYQRLLDLEQKSHICILRNDYNYGFGKSINNFLEKYQEYESLTIINPDIKPLNLDKFNQALYNFLKSEYCYCQPIISDEIRKHNSIQGLKLSNAFSIFLEYTLFRYFKAKRLIVRKKELHKGWNDIFIPSGAFFTVKTAKINKIGGFPVTTFLYYEEWLLADAMKKANEKKFGYIDPTISVEHMVGGTTKLKFGVFNSKMGDIRNNSLKAAVKVIFGNNIIIQTIVALDTNLRSIVNLIIRKYVKHKR